MGGKHSTRGREKYTRQSIATSTFCQFPRFLLSGDFAGTRLSNNARVIYVLLYDRLRVSVKKGWYDDSGEAYCYYTREELEEKLGISIPTIRKAFQELKDISLLRDVKQGLNKPNRIYLFKPVVGKDEDDGSYYPDDGCNPENDDENAPAGQTKSFTPDSKNLSVRTVRNYHPEVKESFTPDSKKLPVHIMKSKNKGSDNKKRENNKSDISLYSYLSNPIKNDRIRCEEKIKKQIDYDILVQDHRHNVARIDEIVQLIIDTTFTSRDTIRIAGDDKPIEHVRERLFSLTGEHVKYVLDSLDNTTTDIRNIKQYLLAALYNAPITIGNYYAAKVAHDWGA